MNTTLTADPITRQTPDATELADFRAHGWTVARGLVDAAALEALRADVLAVVAARNLPDSFLAQASEYLAGSPLDSLVNSPALHAYASGLLGAPAHVYLPFTAVKGPGQGAFAFHQDNQYTLLDGPALNCWVALVDMTVDNGCLRMVTGSHRAGTLASRASAECPGHRTTLDDPGHWDEVAMRAGDVCVFDRLTVHGSGPNRGAAPRIAYAVQFHGRDTRAFFDDAWETLCVRPRHRCAPVDNLSNRAQCGE